MAAVYLDLDLISAFDVMKGMRADEVGVKFIRVFLRFN